MRTLYLATGNKHKVAEIRPLLEGINIEAYAPPGDFEEGTASLVINAIDKARVVADILRKKGEDALVMAEDTGLFVDALKDAGPGVTSSRYAGEGATYKDNTQKLLQAMQRLPPEQRQARFMTICSLVSNNYTFAAPGRLDGAIAQAERGTGGFGYDPVFVPNSGDRTLAEIASEDKIKMSHRTRAIKAMLPYIAQMIK
ncbi:non-canonical purine NTP pyrophosphatase [Elusimicrobiota bacterium]